MIVKNGVMHITEDIFKHQEVQKKVYAQALSLTKVLFSIIVFLMGIEVVLFVKYINSISLIEFSTIFLIQYSILLFCFIILIKSSKKLNKANAITVLGEGIFNKTENLKEVYGSITDMSFTPSLIIDGNEYYQAKVRTSFEIIEKAYLTDELYKKIDKRNYCPIFLNEKNIIIKVE